MRPLNRGSRERFLLSLLSKFSISTWSIFFEGGNLFLTPVFQLPSFSLSLSLLESALQAFTTLHSLFKLCFPQSLSPSSRLVSFSHSSRERVVVSRLFSLLLDSLTNALILCYRPRIRCSLSLLLYPHLERCFPLGQESAYRFPIFLPSGPLLLPNRQVREGLFSTPG